VRPTFLNRILALLGFALSLWQPSPAQTSVGATFGEVFALQGGTPSDVVLDELRHRLYLINNNINSVTIFDYTQNQTVGTIAVGSRPISGAISMDGKYLYVASGVTARQAASGTPLLNVIDLSQNRVVGTQTLKAAPQGVEVGADGRVLISTLGTGVVSGQAQNVLALYDPANQQLLDVTVPALPTTPAPLPTPGLGQPTLSFTGRLMRTPDGNFIIGVITPTSATTYVFVYEAASGVVLRNRTINGASSVISISPDGSRFMAGLTMFDTATLAIIGQQNNANAPFLTTALVNTAQNVGGSAFTPDGTTLYSAFNTAPITTPPSPTLASTLLVNDPTNLGIRMGIKLPESIVGRILLTSDGQDAWGLSDSGILHLPFGKLYEYPILMPQTTQVFLAMDDCNRGVAKGSLQINNIGKGRLTYTVAASTTAALVYQQSSGLAPSSINFSMEPGRSGVVRQPGTNMWTGTVGTQTGAPVNVTLSSPDAINIPPVIRVYMNYRLNDQRGIVYPLPTTANNSTSNNQGNPSGNEGLQDIVLDEARGKVYVTNSGYNRIEVFDIARQHFVDPIPVGQLPHQMAMAGDGKTLYVANTGGESIQILDLDLGRVVDSVVFPAIPRNGTVAAIYPRSLAMGYNGLQFLMSNGSQWKVVGSEAVPRPTDNVTPVTLTGCPACGMASTPGNDFVITLSGNGNAYVYDSTLDTYVTTRQLIPTTGVQGYYGVLAAGPGGAYYLVDGLIVSQSLTTLGGSATPGATTITGGGAPGTPGGGVTVTVINTGNRNVASVAPLNDKQFLRLTTPVRQNITTVTRDDSRTTLDIVNLATGEVTLAGVVPENPVVNVFGTTRYNTNPRQMAVDSAGKTAYAITLSGLSVISLSPSGSDARPSISTGAGAIVNSTDGTSTLHPGSFITISGTNLAGAATADIIPPPTVLGGSCVTFGDIAVPLLVTSSGQIQAQIPDTLPAGTHVVEVRSLATAQESDPVIVTIRPAGN
jgi:DNA-binding beta-propeller fold protein YncE